MIRTFTGRFVDPYTMDRGDVNIEDIAHALSMVNRFNGHTAFPISVAQHSVFVSRLCLMAPLQALLHDASEAYLGDMTKWVKHSEALAGYRRLEHQVQAVIYHAFELPVVEHPEIAVADRLMVRFEGERGFGPGFRVHGIDGGPHSQYPPVSREEAQMIGSWVPWTWYDAKMAFLRRFAEVCEDAI